MDIALAPIDITQIVLSIVTGIFGILGTVCTVLIHRFMQDKKMAALLSAAVKNAVGKVQTASVAEIERARILVPGVNPRYAPAVLYILSQVPEAVDYFAEITNEKLAEKIEAQVGLKNIEANIAINSSSTPIAISPTDPVPSIPPDPGGRPGEKAAANRD